MSTEFNGKKLLVIGGTSGMGLQTARMVLEQGGSVVIVGHREDKAEEARKALSSLGTVTALTADLSRAEDVKRLLHTIDEHHKDINLLVNAAGVFFPKAFLEHTESDYEQYLTLNKAFFFITQKVVANLVASERPGAIVNIGSMWGKQAIAATPSSAYSMAKAGLHSLTQHLAMEPGIQTNQGQCRFSGGCRNADLRGIHTQGRGSWRLTGIQQLPPNRQGWDATRRRRGHPLPVVGQGSMGDGRNLGR